jgi:hypothetical protein
MKKGWWSGSSDKSTCLASVRSRVQNPSTSKKKKKKGLMNTDHISSMQLKTWELT